MIIEERICLYKQSYLMERNNIHLKRYIIHVTRGGTDNALMHMLENLYRQMFSTRRKMAGYD